MMSVRAFGFAMRWRDPSTGLWSSVGASADQSSFNASYLVTFGARGAICDGTCSPFGRGRGQIEFHVHRWHELTSHGDWERVFHCQCGKFRTEPLEPWQPNTEGSMQETATVEGTVDNASLFLDPKAIGREVSPRAIRDFVVSCAKHAARPSADERSLHNLLRGRVLQSWVSEQPEKRAPFESALTIWLFGASPLEAVRHNTSYDPSRVHVRKFQRQVAAFCKFAAKELPIAQAEHDALLAEQAKAIEFRKSHQLERQEDRDELLDMLCTFCEMTHGSAGGDGRTVDQSTASSKGKYCWACAMRSGLFGQGGWCEERDPEKRERLEQAAEKAYGAGSEKPGRKTKRPCLRRD